MKTILFLLLLSTSAVAQGFVGGCVTADGSTAFTATEESCRRQGGTFHPPEPYGKFVILGTNPGISTELGTIVGPPGVTVTGTPMPKCPTGYSLILRSPGNPACARDIIDPE